MNATTTAETTTTTTAAAVLPDGALAAFDVQPSVLDRALRIAQLAASKDNTIPTLNTVNLTVTPAGNLVAMSTDRYRLVRARVETPQDGRTVDALAAKGALIPLAEVKNLLAWLKPRINRRGHELTVAVRITGNGYGPARMQLDACDGSMYVLNLLENAEYPDIHRLVATWSPAETNADHVALNPTYLEQFGKMAGLGCERNTPVEILMHAPNKPVTFRGADADGLVFDGLLMPVRLPGTPADATL